MTIKTDLRKLLTGGKLILGTDRVLKCVRSGKAAKVFLASNAPEEVRQHLLRYQKATAFTIEDTGLTNDELGTACKRPFSVAAIALLS